MEKCTKMFNITVDKADLAKVLAAIDRVGQVVKALAKSIPEESAREFADLLRSNITNQKYGDFGHPHADWKKGQPNEGMYWLWLGTLLKSIQPWNLQSSADIIKWFVGLKYGGSSIPSITSAKRKILAAKPKTLTPQQLRTKEVLRERLMARKAAATGVKHISPEGYILQRKNTVGTQLAGGKSVSLGKEIRKKRILSDTSSD